MVKHQQLAPTVEPLANDHRKNSMESSTSSSVELNEARTTHDDPSLARDHQQGDSKNFRIFSPPSTRRRDEPWSGVNRLSSISINASSAMQTGGASHQILATKSSISAKLIFQIRGDRRTRVQSASGYSSHHRQRLGSGQREAPS